VLGLLPGERARDRQQGRFRGVVGAEVLAPHQRVGRGHDDDAGAGLPAQRRERGLAEVHAAHDVDREQRLPLGGVGLRDGREVTHRGVAHQHVEGAEPVHRLAHRVRRLRGIGDVGHAGVHLGAGHARADRGRALSERTGVAVHEKHLRALGTEELGRGAPDASGAAGDQCRLARHPAAGFHGVSRRRA
jgi:hypothetical protein